jgi:hypothetical protein
LVGWGKDKTLPPTPNTAMRWRKENNPGRGFFYPSLNCRMTRYLMEISRMKKEIAGEVPKFFGF